MRRMQAARSRNGSGRWDVVRNGRKAQTEFLSILYAGEKENKRKISLLHKGKKLLYNDGTKCDVLPHGAICGWYVPAAGKRIMAAARSAGRSGYCERAGNR